MVVLAEQCSFCRRVRYYSKNGWSSWISKVPASYRIEYYQINTCDSATCQEECQEFIASCDTRRLVVRR